MPVSSRVLGVSLAAVSFAAVLCSVVRPQGSGSSRVPSQGTRPYAPPAQRPPQQQTPEAFYRSFWTHLNKPTSPYTTWARFPAGAQDLRPGNPPHGAHVKTFANSTAAGNAALPVKSILVAENYDDPGQRLQSIMVLYRVPGATPAGDWYWLEYSPEGQIARDKASNKAIAGRVQSCIDCHGKAGDGDFVFANDAAAAAPQAPAQGGNP